MPTFKIRLEDPNSDEFRLYAIAAESEEAAVAELKRRERKRADYRLTTDEMEAIEAGDVPAAQAKAMLLTHEQADPYEVVSVEDYTGGFWKAAAEARAGRKGD
jgi:hypothetical protein